METDFTYILCLDCGYYAVESTDGVARQAMDCDHIPRWSVRRFEAGHFVS